MNCRPNYRAEGNVMDDLSIATRDNAAFGEHIRRLEAFKGYFPEKQDALTSLECKLGYTFNDKSLLIEALTHRSAAAEFDAYIRKRNSCEASSSPTQGLRWNERLEFLGDSVLGLAVTTLIWEQNLGFDEGKMSRLKAAAVSEPALASVARSLALGDHVFLGRGELQADAANRDSLLADALEAIFGAIYMDGGVMHALDTITLHMKPLLIQNELIGTDYKTTFQELIQQKLQVTPTYRCLNEVGPDHRKHFEVGVFISDNLVATGTGLSKKLASQNAAYSALRSGKY